MKEEFGIENNCEDQLSRTVTKELEMINREKLNKRVGNKFILLGSSIIITCILSIFLKGNFNVIEEWIKSSSGTILIFLTVGMFVIAIGISLSRIKEDKTNFRLSTFFMVCRLAIILSLFIQPSFFLEYIKGLIENSIIFIGLCLYFVVLSILIEVIDMVVGFISIIRNEVSEKDKVTVVIAILTLVVGFVALFK
ncbi:hypothetical protein [Solibacillus sp. FSL H8-0538]|uniref:hypothetical protein n=1 Tax=Solibacillus sp. FSL H8-0538 TaxID=2921400 RepID=UPI0030F89960